MIAFLFYESLVAEKLLFDLFIFIVCTVLI